MSDYVPYWDRKKQISAREKQLLEYEKQGLTHAEIALLWNVKPETIDHMKWRIKKKLSNIYEPPGGNNA